MMRLLLLSLCVLVALPGVAAACSFAGGVETYEKVYEGLAAECSTAGGKWKRASNDVTDSCEMLHSKKTRGAVVVPCFENYCECGEKQCYSTMYKRCMQHDSWEKNFRQKKEAEPTVSGDRGGE